MKRLSIDCELVSGDRLPGDTWRVTLYLGEEWMMYREWSTGINNEHSKEAKREAYAFADRIREALEN